MITPAGTRDELVPDQSGQENEPVSSSAPLFYQTFLNLRQREQLAVADSANFYKFLVEKEGRTVAIIFLLAPTMVGRMIKPQQLLADHEDYYLARDIFTNTFYLCYRQLMMIDVDFYGRSADQSPEVILTQLASYCQGHPEKRYRLFRSQKGLHIFRVDSLMDYTQPETLQEMLDLGADGYYTTYAYLRGWSVRLNRKEVEPADQSIYSFMQTMGTGKSNEKCEELVLLHLRLVQVFSQEEPSKMYGG